MDTNSDNIMLIGSLQDVTATERDLTNPHDQSLYCYTSSLLLSIFDKSMNLFLATNTQNSKIDMKFIKISIQAPSKLLHGCLYAFCIFCLELQNYH